MAIVLNRTAGLAAPYDKDLRFSVNTPDFPVADWIINPDLTAVAGFASIYWDIVGDNVVLVDQATRDARDAELASTELVDRRAQAAAKPDSTAVEGMEVRALIELFNKRDNYLVNRIAELQAALDAVKASSGPADNIRNAIPASWLPTNTRPRPDAIQEYKDDINAGVAD
jgi:hypothetical protein